MDATNRKHQTLCAEEENWIKLVDKLHLHSMLKHLLGQYYFRINFASGKAWYTLLGGGYTSEKRFKC